MHWLDTVILGVLAIGALFGTLTGFLWQLSRILTVALAAYATIAFNERATQLVQQHMMPEASAPVPQVTAYVMVFLLVCIIMYILTLALHRAVRRVKLQWLNRTVGGVFGAAKAAIVLGAVFLMVSHFGLRESLQKSRMALPLADGVKTAATFLPDSCREQIEEPVVDQANDFPRILEEIKKNAKLPQGSP